MEKSFGIEKKTCVLKTPMVFNHTMEALIKYRGRTITAEDAAFIRQLITDNPGLSRWKLSRRLCEAWNWVQPNGALRDMICRSLMLELDRAGHIKLPPRKRTILNPLANRRKPSKTQIDQTPFKTTVKEITPLEIRQVRRTQSEKLFNSLIEQYHYLGYTQPVGEHLKYMVWADERPIACFSFSSAPRHIGVRDRFIGWDKRLRQQNIHLMAYNSRFLLLPWMQVRHLASHLLGKITRRISTDWQQMYNHGVYYLETFVDTERFEGTCYKAANWIYLGKTTGRGKNDHTNKKNRSLKAVWGYPLHRKFRQFLCEHRE